MDREGGVAVKLQYTSYSPALLRQDLLQQIIKANDEGIPVELHFCMSHIFPDVSLTRWAAARHISITNEQCHDPSKYRVYTFLVFREETVNDDEL